MSSVVPAPRMVVVPVIIMCFVATCQRHGDDAYKEQDADTIFEPVFHGGRLCRLVHKACQGIIVC